MHPAGLVRLLGCLRTEYQSQFILVPRAHDPSGLWQESRALAGPDFLPRDDPSGLRQACSEPDNQSISFVLSTNQVCQIWREVGESRTSGVGQSQSSRFLPQARRIVGSGDENGPNSESSPSIKTRSLHTIFARYKSDSKL